MRACALTLLVFLCGCGASTERRAGGIGMSTHGREPVADGAIELALRRPDGRFVDVGDLRGHVVVLFLFATFDAMSQLVLHPLRVVIEERPQVRVIGVAVQPGARLLVDAYQHALNPPFPVTYDPEERVHTGESALGAIEAVPTFIVLDARGVPVARHVGLIDADGLRELLAAARP